MLEAVKVRIYQNIRNETVNLEILKYKNKIQGWQRNGHIDVLNPGLLLAVVLMSHRTRQ